MKTKRAYYINRALFISPIFIGLCLSEKQFNKECKKLKIPEELIPEFTGSGDDGRTHYLTNEKCDNVCLVCINNYKNIGKSELIGLLVHESVHIWQFIKNDIQEKNASSEFEAYCMQAIVQELFNKINQDKGRGK